MSAPTVQVVTPRTFLQELNNQRVLVKMKWGMEYSGILRCSDVYLNLQLEKAVEYIEGEKMGQLDELIIRCNNVLTIRKDDTPQGSDD